LFACFWRKLHTPAPIFAIIDAKKSFDPSEGYMKITPMVSSRRRGLDEFLAARPFSFDDARAFRVGQQGRTVWINNLEREF